MEEEESQNRGEVSLAHYGVLFLDELTEFNKNTLELLRGPLEDGIINISRVNAALTYPCNFMFIASMNPCPCGFYGSKDKECTCSKEQIKKYIGKISGPLLDRIDIHLEVSSVKYEKLRLTGNTEHSEQIKKRVDNARRIQQERYKEYGIFSNSELSPKLIEKYCKLDEKSNLLLESSFKKFGLSARAYGRILKVARTIADLEKSEDIQINHVAEAIQYRSLDKKYWNHWEERIVIELITKESKFYPEQLRRIKNPPEVLYVEGNKEILNSKSISIIGSRACSDEGRKIARIFARDLAYQNMTIVSGMAIGIDTAAHIGTLDASGHTIAVLGCGFKNIFPPQNTQLFHRIIKNGGAVISEYSPNTSAKSQFFLERNRIVSGLSIGILVIEAAYRSGTSVTAAIAKEQNKKVFCIPHEMDNYHGVRYK